MLKNQKDIFNNKDENLINQFKRIIININIHEAIHIFTEISLIKPLTDFFDHLVFTLNVHKIMNENMKQIYKEMQTRLFNVYNIKQTEDKNSVSSCLNFLMINFEIGKLNLFVNSYARVGISKRNSRREIC